MKTRTRTSVFAIALALLMALAAIPVIPVRAASAVEPCWTVPDGYDEYDYNAIASFLEQEDENGVKNGVKIDPNYNPNDPMTWGGEYDISWTEVEGTLHLRYVDWEYLDLCGALDLSECTSLFSISVPSNMLTQVFVPDCLMSCNVAYNKLIELDVSGCTGLFNMDCSGNPDLAELDVSHNTELSLLKCELCSIRELDLSNNTNIQSLFIYSNDLTEIDVSNLPQLFSFYCSDNRIEELDLSENPNLHCLCCDNNELTALDLSNNPLLFQLKCDGNHLDGLDLSCCPDLPFDGIFSHGNGNIGYFYEPSPQTIVYAEPEEGYSFIGWYNDEGELLSADEEFNFIDIIDTETVLIARFTGGEAIPGDVDHDGEVTVSDAIMALRAAMGILELTPEQLAAADMDGSGEVRIDDAIIILRTAMGLLD